MFSDNSYKWLHQVRGKEELRVPFSHRNKHMEKPNTGKKKKQICMGVQKASQNNLPVPKSTQYRLREYWKSAGEKKHSKPCSLWKEPEEENAKSKSSFRKQIWNFPLWDKYPPQWMTGLWPFLLILPPFPGSLILYSWCRAAWPHQEAVCSQILQLLF